MSKIHVVENEAARIALTIARESSTPSGAPFAAQVHRLGRVLAVHALADVPAQSCSVITPLGKSVPGVSQRGRVALVPILRAGKALEEPFKELLQRWCVWDFGLRRNEQTLEPELYLDRIPQEMPPDVELCVVLEIMLATGGSALKVVETLKQRGAKKIKFVCVLAAPKGMNLLHQEHPDIDIFTLSVDDRLTGANDDFPAGYIVPGLGDAGKRLNDSAE